MQIKFDAANRPEPLTFILAKRNGDKTGGIANVIPEETHVSDDMNKPSEVSFKVYKYLNGSECLQWNDIRDFCVIYVLEWNKYFEASVTLHIDKNSGKSASKTVSCTALQESELSNLKLFGVEINTEKDMARSDYVPTMIYNADNPKGSLLDRIITDKAPHYTIVHVDSSIADLKRILTFTFDDKSIYDALQEISKEINCLFVFGEDDGSDHPAIKRTISVYDLESTCNDCGYRGEFVDTCPECGSAHVTNGYGEDTTIFLSPENLADNVTYSSDSGSVKNCFRLEAGDDLMTATIRNANPSGSDYIWYLSEEVKKEMSEELRNALDEYDEDYNYYKNDHICSINAASVNSYNSLVNKYKIYNNGLEQIRSPITGYQNLMLAYYNTIDLYGYLNNSLMPNIERSQTTAQLQAALLTGSSLSPISAKDTSCLSKATVDSMALSYAKTLIDTSKYKIKVSESTLNGLVWRGRFVVTSYTDEDDTAATGIIVITVNDDYENYIKQSIDRTMAKSDAYDFSISGLFDLEDGPFKAELKKYSLSSLVSINDICQSCLDILIEQGISNPNNDWIVSEEDLYTKLYTPYYTKKSYIEAEILIRENELKIIRGSADSAGNMIYGIQDYIEEERNAILSDLDFESRIGNCWEELCSFRRDDLWKNDNYISEGLSNSELFERANKFIESANKEIYKSATMQHKIQAALKNLLAMECFRPIVKYFKTGNWIRISVDDAVYRLRLLRYEIDYSDFNKITVEFSDVIKQLGCISDIQSIIDQSKSMASSYSSTKHQAEIGAESKATVDSWVKNGLDATTTKIVNNADDQDIVYDEHGMLFRKHDPISDTYSPTQLKIINSTLAMTNDAWETTKTAIGEFIYFNPKTSQYETGYGVIADQLVGNIILSNEMGIYTENGNMTFDKESGLLITNGTHTVNINPNSDEIITVYKEDDNAYLLSFDSEGQMQVRGKVYTSEGEIGDWILKDGCLVSKDSNDKYVGMATNNVSNPYAFFAGGTESNGTDAPFKVGFDGGLITSNLTVENNGIVVKSVDENGKKINSFYAKNGNVYARSKFTIFGTPDDTDEKVISIISSTHHPSKLYMRNDLSSFELSVGAELNSTIIKANDINIIPYSGSDTSLKINNQYAVIANNKLRFHWTGSELEIYLGNTKIKSI